MISIHKTLVLEQDIHFDIHCITCICIQEVMYSMVSESIVKYIPYVGSLFFSAGM